MRTREQDLERKRLEPLEWVGCAGCGDEYQVTRDAVYRRIRDGRELCKTCGNLARSGPLPPRLRPEKYAGWARRAWNLMDAETRALVSLALTELPSIEDVDLNDPARYRRAA